MPTWFRITLYATAIVNLGGAATFLPAMKQSRALVGLPEPAAPLYLWIIAVWIFLFGVCYLWLATQQRQEWLFIAIGASGKLSFFAILAASAVAGEIPPQAVAAGLWDLVVGCLFVVWLVKYRPSSTVGG